MSDTTDRISAALPLFISDLVALRKELGAAKNEAQTRLLIFDFMRAALGFHTREAELEYNISGWKADIAIEVDSKTARVSRPSLIVECKCVTVPLSSRHADQAARYAGSRGIRWAILTNGLDWRIFSIPRSRSGDTRPVCIAHLDLESESGKSAAVAFFRAISRDGLKGDMLAELADRQARFNKYVCAQLLLEDASVDALVSRFRSLDVGDANAKSVRDMLLDILDPDVTSPSRDGVKSARKILSRRPVADPEVPAPAPTEGAERAEEAPSCSALCFSRKGIEAKCRRDSSGFTVFAGQSICPTLSPSAVGKGIDRLRRGLIADGTIVDFRFVRDYTFKSGSAAAGVILGSDISGNLAWKPVL